MDKAIITSQIKKIYIDLDTIFTNNIICSKILSDITLQKAIEQTLSILAFLEPKTPKFKKILKKYEEISQKTCSLSKIDVSTKEEESDLIDQINWLSIYCSNTYNIDISINKPVHTINNAEVKNLSENTIKQNEIITDAIGGQTNPEGVFALNQKIAQAAMKFSEDINSGKIYIFTSKPKIIPIIKKIYNFSFLLSILSIIAIAIMGFSSSSLPSSLNLDWENSLLLLLMGLTFCTFTIIGFSAYLKNKKLNNDNFIYQFRWHGAMFVLILVIFSSTLSVFTDENSKNIFLNFHAASKINSTFCTLYIVFCGLMFFFLTISLISLIIGAVFSPKRDEKKIEELYKEYIKNI